MEGDTLAAEDLVVGSVRYGRGVTFLYLNDGGWDNVQCFPMIDRAHSWLHLRRTCRIRGLSWAFGFSCCSEYLLARLKISLEVVQ